MLSGAAPRKEPRERKTRTRTAKEDGRRGNRCLRCWHWITETACPTNKGSRGHSIYYDSSVTSSQVAQCNRANRTAEEYVVLIHTYSMFKQKDSKIQASFFNAKNKRYRSRDLSSQRASSPTPQFPAIQNESLEQQSLSPHFSHDFFTVTPTLFLPLSLPYSLHLSVVPNYNLLELVPTPLKLAQIPRQSGTFRLGVQSIDGLSTCALRDPQRRPNAFG
ncbi:hypothetical protein L596_024375 [Steinernema carpocapsae]|uniref:Uncharacterized protein n=1 Tax=Steinernema carpocapsae TaxID=34508 RepID=A0A4V5ZZP9_STECR|nr:hypothetical protein L596_024375 [Steinernema carpocapsae]